MARAPRDPLGSLGGLFTQANTPSGTLAKASQEPEAIGVTELSGKIRSALEGSVGRVRVKGEISNTRCVSGHWYFSLKDDASRIDCVLFRGDAAKCRETPRDGAAVIASAQVTHYPPQGRTQLQCSLIEPVGEGELATKFRVLCDELRAAGWFDPAKKVPLPSVPRCLAIVTSAGSAAEADCLNAARERFPAVRLMLVDARVQGAQAAPALAATLRALDEAAPRLGIDAILLVRGGGSLEDLWAFNERVVAEAIFRMKTPIVTGIGHESDTTIADLVADLRAPTPSRAVTESLPDRSALGEEVDSLAHRLGRGWTMSYERRSARVDLAARSRALSDPATPIEVRQTALSHAAHRLTQGILRRVETARAREATLSRTLEAVSPLSVLNRGYSITLDESGSAVTTAELVTAGQRMRTIVAHGEIASVVEAVTKA
jgi:exodeoxyribonuclease VII large subunit